MKTISYIFGILVLLVTMSSCTLEEMELAKKLQDAGVTQQMENAGNLLTEFGIDPPKPPQK